jgi:hypothetical protein
VTLIRPFIPAKDFALSRAFYEAIGFVEKYSDDKLAILDQDGAGILLQDNYVKEWAENCMAQLFVPDLDGWWVRTEGLAERFGVKKPRAPKMQDWGIRVGFLWDPSGVLWHVNDPGELLRTDMTS